MLTNIFTYGTLMFEPVWIKVTGSPHNSQKAILTGFERKSVKDQFYPVLIPSKNQLKLQGVVYCDIDEATLCKLDMFEGDSYLRKIVRVNLYNGDALDAQTYILKKEYYHIIGSTDWDPLQFEIKDMGFFLNSLFF